MPCSPARGSGRCTPSCSAASAPSRCAIASTTPRPRCSSPPTAAGAAAQVVPLKQMADEALEGTPSIRHVVIVQRLQGSPAQVHVKEGRDHWYHRLMQEAPYHCEPERMDAEDMLYILYTSGTTGKAEGHRAHDRRLPRRHLRHHEVGLRSQGRRRLLVHRRYRLGDRAQLRRLRPAQPTARRS